MNSQSRRYLYTKCAFTYIIKNNFLIGFFYLFDFLSILSFITLVPLKLKSYNKAYNEKDNYLYYFSIYNLYKEYIPTDDVGYMITLIVIVIVILIVYYVLLLFLTKDSVNISGTKMEIFKKIYVNFYEFILFRALSIYIFDSYITCIVECVYKSFQKNGEVYGIIEFFLILIFFYLVSDTIGHLSGHAVVANLKAYNGTLGDYPFDMKFSATYDLICIIMKIFICIEKNVLIKGNHLITYKIFFLNVVPFIIIWIYFIYIMLTFYVTTHELLYFPLKKTSTIRNCLITFACVSSVICLLIDEKKVFLFYFFEVIFFAFILFFFLSHDETTVLEVFYNSRNYISMLIFLISNDLDYNQIIAKWIINHKVTCKVENCSICPFIVKTFGETIPNEITIEEFFSFVVTVIGKELENGNLVPTPEELVYLDLIKLYDMQFKNETQRLKYYLASYQYLIKYRGTNTTIYYNILVMFEKKMEENVDFNKSYAAFRHSEEVFVLYNEFFNEIDNFMRYKNKNPDNIISISDKLFNFAKHPKILSLIKNSSSYSYEILLLRYIFEVVAVKSLNENYEFLEMNNFDEYLEFHFAHDNFLLIHYGLVAKDCTIIKSSYDFRKYLNYSLDNLFPSDLRQFGKEKFIISINTNDFKDDLNIFEYIVINFKSQKLMTQGFLESFYMKYVSFPSIDSGEVLVSGHYLLGNKDVLIFKQEAGKEYLVSFSEKMGGILKINPEIVANLAVSQKYFTFHKMFKKVILNEDEQAHDKRNLRKKVLNMENEIKNTKETNFEKIKENERELRYLLAKEKEKEEEIVVQINFERYLKTLSEHLIENTELKNPEERINEFKESKNFLNKLNFILNKKYEIDTDGALYYVYYVITEKHGVRTNDKREQNDDAKKLENNFNESISKYVQNTVGDASSVTGSTGTYSKGNKLKLSGRDKLREEEKQDFEKLKIFSNVISGINILLIILGFLFLLLLLINDSNFTKLFNLFQRYKYFMRGVQTEEMRLVSNVCIVYPKNATKCSCYFQEFSYNLQKKLKIEGFGMDISTVVYNQFRENFNTINSHYLNFKQNVFELSTNYIDAIENEVILIPTSTTEYGDSDGSKYVREESFLEGINVFLNYLVQVINNDTLRETPIQYFTVGIDYKISNLDLITCTQEQRNIYYAFMNYPFVERALLNVQNLIKTWFSSYLTDINDILIGFAIGIVVLNFILIGITIFFIYEFIIVLNRKLETIKTKFASVSFMKYFKSKFLNLKSLLALYEKMPMTIVTLINKEKEEYVKLNVIEKKEEVIIPEKLKKRIREENIKSFRPLLKRNISIIVVLYTIYFSVAVILYILMNNKFSNLKTLVTFINYNAEIDNYLSFVLNSLQIMVITNTSQYDFGYFVHSNISEPLISNYIKEHLFVMKMIKHIEEKNPGIYSDISIFDHVACEDLKTFHDGDFEAIIPEGESDKYYSYLTDVCNALGILEYQNQDLVMNNIIFLEEKLLKGILKVPYDEKLDYLDKDELYEIYSLHLVIMRILRSYLNESALPKLINEVLSAHKNIFVVCLTVNLVLELTIMILLHCFIPKKLLTTNTKVGLFIYFLD